MYKPQKVGTARLGRVLSQQRDTKSINVSPLWSRLRKLLFSPLLINATGLFDVAREDTSNSPWCADLGGSALHERTQILVKHSLPSVRKVCSLRS